MTGDNPLRRPARLAATLGREPRLADFTAAMAEGRRRRRRRGLRSAGAGAVLAAVVGAAVGLGGVGGGASARNEIRFVDDGPAGVPHDRLDAVPAELGLPDLGEPAEPPYADGSGSRADRSGAGADGADDGADQRQPHSRRPAYRTETSTLVPRTCTTSVDWCLQATVRSGGKGKGHNLFATLCLNASQPFGNLDFGTAQEVDFELLAGSRVIWRWSDGQSFAPTPHQLSGTMAGCFVWQTFWDQHDGRGAKVGAARLSLRVRSLASQPTNPKAAVVAFATTAF